MKSNFYEQSHFSKTEIVKIVKIILNQEKENLFFDSKIKYDADRPYSESSCISYLDGEGYRIFINLLPFDNWSKNQEENDTIVASLIKDAFHEIEHTHQYESIRKYVRGEQVSDEEKERAISSIVCGRFQNYYRFKYKMLPQEINAEIRGIERAREFCKRYFPSFDFDKAIVDWVNEQQEWFGIEKESIKFDSVDEMLFYLYQNREASYNFPCDAPEYFSVQTDSSNCAGLKNGSEQYLAMMMEMVNQGRYVPTVCLKDSDKFVEKYVGKSRVVFLDKDILEKSIENEAMEKDSFITSRSPIDVVKKCNRVFGSKEEKEAVCEMCEEECEERNV